MSMTWEKRCLGELCSLFTDGDWIETKDQSISGIRLIQTGNVGESIFKNRLDKARWITQSKFDELKCQEVLPGDILISRLPDPVGRACIIPQLGVKCITGVDCSIVRLSHEIDANWFIRYSQSKAYQAQIESSVTGTTRKRISRKNLGKVEIPLPPLDEQKRIAGILDEADRVRKKTQALIDKYDELAQSLFLDMFGDPVTNPKGWARKRIEEFFKFSGGSQPPKSVFQTHASQGYVRLIQIRDYKTDKYMTYIPEHSTKKFCSPDDIMIGRYGPPVFQILRGLEGAYNVALMKAIPEKNVNREFGFHLLSSKYVQDIVVNNSKRTAGQSGVNLKLLNSIDVPLPPYSEQCLFEDRIFQIRSNANSLAKEHRVAEDLFNALLQKAFKGELN